MNSTDEWVHHLEEYKLSQESRHHHERTMWQLLAFYLAATGLLLQFWLSADPFVGRVEESNSFLVLFVPFFLGIFAVSALSKHRFFWGLELQRARKLESLLGFEREKAFAYKYYSSPIRFVRSWDLSVLAVGVTVGGLAYLIGRSFWLKPPVFWDLFLFPLYVVALAGSAIGYGLYRRYSVAKERRELDKKSYVPPPNSPYFRLYRVTFWLNVSLAFVGTFLLWWSLQMAFSMAGDGQPLEQVWISSYFTWVAIGAVLGSGVITLFRVFWLDKKIATSA